jgi:hypothetical protein
VKTSYRRIKINKNKNETRDIREKVERQMRAPWVRCREKYL